MLQQQYTTVKHTEFTVAESVDIMSPFDLGVMDAEDGMRMQPESYFVQAKQMREYRNGYTLAMETMADVAYPESNEVTYNAYGDRVS